MNQLILNNSTSYFQWVRKIILIGPKLTRSYSSLICLLISKRISSNRNFRNCLKCMAELLISMLRKIRMANIHLLSSNFQIIRMLINLLLKWIKKKSMEEQWKCINFSYVRRQDRQMEGCFHCKKTGHFAEKGTFFEKNYKFLLKMPKIWKFCPKMIIFFQKS